MKKQIIIQTEGKKVQIDRNNMYKKWSGKPFKWVENNENVAGKYH